MREHFYTFPRVVELVADRERNGMSRGAGPDRQPQPAADDRAGRVEPRFQTRASREPSPA